MMFGERSPTKPSLVFDHGKTGYNDGMIQVHITDILLQLQLLFKIRKKINHWLLKMGTEPLA